MPFNRTRTRELTRPTCLRHFAGRDSIRSAVFDSTTLVADGNGRFIVPIGSFLTKSTTDPTKVKIYQALGANANAVQTITITGEPTGGSFTLTYAGQTTAAIRYNASAAEVAAAVGALSNVGVPNVSGGGGALPGTAVTIRFQGLLGNQPQPLMTANGAGLTGGTTPRVSVATTTPGTTAEKIIGVFDGPDVDYFGNTVADDEPVPVYYHGCVFDISKLQGWQTYGATAKAELPTCDFY